MTTIDEVFAFATPVTRTVELCLAGELQAEWEELDRKRTRLLQASPGDSLIGGAGSEELRKVEKRMEDLRKRMEKATVTFKIRGLPKRRWSDLCAQHPPRKEDTEAGRDYNAETLPVAALAECCVEPKMTREQAERLIDEVLTQAQWDELWFAVLRANNFKIDVPKSVSSSV